MTLHLGGGGEARFPEEVLKEKLLHSFVCKKAFKKTKNKLEWTYLVPKAKVTILAQTLSTCQTELEG